MTSHTAFVRTAAAALAIGVALAVAPALAQDEPRPSEELKRQLDEVWNELMDEVAPMIDGVSRLVETLEQIDSLENYDEPTILPNGDILLRRKPDAPPLEPGPRRADPVEPDSTPGGTEDPEEGGSGIRT